LINLVKSVPVFRNTISITFRLSFPVTGFLFLVNSNIAFSFWFFNLFATMLQGVFNITGISSTEYTSVFGAGPIFSHMGIGSFLAFVSFGVWTARSHLRDVFRKAFRGDELIDDSEEMLSYRTAVICLISGIAFMSIWLISTGIPFRITLLFIFVMLVLFLGLTKIVSQGGIPSIRLPEVPSAAVVSAVGSSNIGAEGVVGLGLTAPYSTDVRTLVMCSGAHGLKMSEKMGKKKRLLFPAMFLAITVGIVTSLCMVIYLAYTQGGINLNEYYFTGAPKYAYEYTADKILHPAGPNGIGWLCKGIGVAGMSFLMVMQNRFLWWPLHPLGFAIGPVWLMSQIWFSVFLAWFLKSLILRYGGSKVYKKTVPFFLGLVLGQYTCAGLWFVIDCFTRMEGNVVFWI